jgi:antitoxin component YwqK of YwqJK toxin-antitoxin module
MSYSTHITFHENGNKKTILKKDPFHPIITTAFYKNGSVKSEKFFTNGKKNGPYKEFFDNGSIKKIENYSSGKLHGKQEEMYTNGDYKSVRWYNAGIPSQTHSFFFENGNLETQMSFENGKLHGKNILFYSSGLLNEIQFFFNGKPHGRSIKFFADEKVQYIRFYHFGKKIGTFREFHSNGELRVKFRYNKKGEKTGSILVYDENGQGVSRYQYKNDKKHGSIVHYYTDNSIKSVQNFHNGLLHGSCTKYFPSGGIEKQFHYENNLRYGPFQKSIKKNDKTIRVEGFYKFNYKDGNEIHYENNVVSKAIKYKYGTLHGAQNYFSPIKKTEYCKHGDIILFQYSLEDTCCVCWEKTFHRTRCAHHICLTCIDNIGLKCPMCRQELLP